MKNPAFLLRSLFKKNVTEKKIPTMSQRVYYLLVGERRYLQDGGTLGTNRFKNIKSSISFFLRLNIFLLTLHGENFMAIFTTLSIVICFSMGTLGIFATLVYVFTMRTIIPILATSILFCNLCYIYYCKFFHAVW